MQHSPPVALFATAVICLAGVLIQGQVATQVPTAGPQPVFHSGVEVVHVTVTVTDAHGRLVSGLTKDDFEIAENGVPQLLTHFTGERVPVSLAVVLDVSDSMHGERMEHAHAALDEFVVDLLDPSDEVALVTFNHHARLAAPWTTPPALLRYQLRAVKPFGGTAIYDALLETMPLFAVRAHQRAAMVLISDGADTASDADLRTLRLKLQRNDAFVYAIAIDALKTAPINRRINPEALRDITDQSGGYTEVVRETVELRPATARIADELNHQYMLGYTPSREPDGEYRRIRVRVKTPDYVVRARRGYIATAKRDS